MKHLDLERIVSTLVWMVLVATIVACGAPSEEQDFADLVLFGGKVVTVNEAQPEAQALAVKGAGIIALGTDDELQTLIGPETRVVDLAGRLAIPGFIEGHGHFMSLGNAKTILDLTAAQSWEEIVAMVEEATETAGDGDWILGRGWHQEKWSSLPASTVEGAPTHHSLSAISPANPVLLVHASGHAAFANLKALEIAALDAESENPAGGELVRDQQGQLTGLLRETAQRLVRIQVLQSRADHSPAEVEAERRRLVDLAGADALSKGVTSFHDAGASFEMIDFFRQLESEQALPVRLYVMVRGESNEEMNNHLLQYRMEAEENDFLTVRSIKRQIDGALGAHGAWLLEPYEDLPESIGLVLEPEEEIRRTAEIALQQGFQVNTHAIGDRANRRVLDIYEEVFGLEGKSGDLRWRVEHAQHLHPDDLRRFVNLGVIASMQGVHCTSDGPWVAKRLGEERAAEGAYLWRELIDSGAIVTNGTDVPVEDIDPIVSYHSSVTRRMVNGELFYPEHRMSREEALRSYTINNAYAAFEEDLKGSLEVGKLADIVVLSQDILSVPDDDILKTRVDYTIVGGQVRFERGD